jgi:perosamine synthetase
VFRNHGITTDHRQREAEGSWFYEMVELGFNYRLTDFQCALGESQLRKLPAWVARRRAIARRYDEAFAGNGLFAPLAVRPGVTHAHHLYVVQLRLERLRAGAGRREVFAALRSAGIGVNVHYVPVHLHPYYRKRFGTGPGLCPRAEAAYERILTLPLFARMTDEQVATVIDTTLEVISSFAA